MWTLRANIYYYLFFSSISHFATADQYTDTTIRVITIEKRQYGRYTCKAANKLGTAEAQVELFGKCLFKIPLFCLPLLMKF